MKKTILLSFAMVVTLGLGTAHAAGGVTVDPTQATFQGNCNSSTLEIIDNADGTLDFFFDEPLFAEADDSVRRDSRRCVVRMPVTIEPNVECAVSTVSFEGIAQVEDGGTVDAVLRHRFAGTSGAASIKRSTPSPDLVDLVFEKRFGFQGCPCSSTPQTREFKTTVQVVAQQDPNVSGYTWAEVSEGAMLTYGFVCRPCSL